MQIIKFHENKQNKSKILKKAYLAIFQTTTLLKLQVTIIYFLFVSMSRSIFNQYGNDHQHYANLIVKMCDSYHNSSIALLQNQISYHEGGQYLKRFYQENQYANKIHVLSDFYKYHRQLPRLLHSDLRDIIQNYQEDWRTLEYKFVSKKMKEAPTDQLALTSREKTNRAVEKVLKNIQLSYYNFQNKNDKKVKANENHTKNKHNLLNRNKKSMPLLPLYQFQKQKNVIPKSKIQTIKVLGIKDMNRNTKKSKHKHVSKKASANNSIEQPKHLSRTKSKCNLVTAFGLQQNKRNSIKPQPDKMKSTQVSLQKAQSTKNILERKKSEVKSKVIKLDQRNQQGVKYMFKRLSQVKNTIKTGR